MRDRVRLRRALESAAPTAWAIAEISCARHVLPLWMSAFGAVAPADLLALAEREVVEGGKRETLSSAADRFRLMLESIVYEAGDTGQFAAVAAGFSAWAAAHSVLGDLPMADAASDLEVEPDDWDASFHASVAAAGGAPWEATGDADRRRGFWTWYLTTALPHAVKGVFSS